MNFDGDHVRARAQQQGIDRARDELRFVGPADGGRRERAEENLSRRQVAAEDLHVVQVDRGAVIAEQSQLKARE